MFRFFGGLGLQRNPSGAVSRWQSPLYHSVPQCK